MDRERNQEYRELGAEAFTGGSDWSKWTKSAYYALHAFYLYGTPMGQISLLHRFGISLLDCYNERTRRNDEYRHAVLERRREEYQHQ